MRRVFVDTGAWDAIEDDGDPHHTRALQFKNEISEKCVLVTSDYVLDETFTLLLMNIGYERTILFGQTIETLRRTGVLQVIHVMATQFAEAWEVFQRFNKDKSWSFTDCTTHVIMKQMGIQEAFAFDRHFEQMGFFRFPN